MVIRFCKWIWRCTWGRISRHRHCNKTWKLIDTTLLPTAYEQLMQSNDVTIKIRKRAKFLFQREVILTYQCVETGEIKVVSSMEDVDKKKHLRKFSK